MVGLFLCLENLLYSYANLNSQITPYCMSLSQQVAKQIVEKLKAAGHTALFAGGWVRDFVLGHHVSRHPSQDVDIATSAHPKEVMAIFPRSIAVGAQFGVVRIIVQNIEFEVATFRSDRQYVDGRHPEKVDLLSSPQEDAQRRDFTINGMFYDPISEELLDYVGGCSDITHKIIRTIGNPYHRFKEDRLRIIRAIRFKNRFGFSIDPDTWQAICEESPHVIEAVSRERIWQELQKMQDSSILAPSLRDMAKTSLLFSLFPSLENISQESLENRFRHVDSYTGSSLIAAICLLVQEKREALIQRFHLSNREKEIIATFSSLESSSKDEESLVHLFARPDIEICLQAYSCTTDDPEQFLRFFIKKQEELSLWVEQLRSNSFLIQGGDLLSLGLQQGKTMGKWLQRAFLISLQKKITNKKELLDIVKKELP